ncbi:MAG: acetyl/propionyl-CoA carboxylase subunit alpha, partial [Burkholderiaceae bacterium]|nr:acetyl/propionyl-CoA carboxylase subunit alpha [Microbacteriaceae bacterium]
MTPFRTVLVANRGEIACRVLRTLRSMGIRSVAVYSDADAGSLHVRQADVAVRIGPPAAAASYLDSAAIVAAALATGADAVHPGYGFLSENADFARACAAAGLVFIGPTPEAIDLMGDKTRAKAHVSARGVSVIAGSSAPDHGALGDAELATSAREIGFPLLIKPSAGGGGKGMHMVGSADDLAAAIVSARRVALASFGDDTLLLERMIETPRHIEVQVLADAHGAVIHLGERECSLQRRHQKVIEEAPSPLLDAATRTRIGEAACEVARSVGYHGAGTVEFLVAAAAPDDFFFLEMNTRLQVEHPVTELVTGIDLVEWQLRVAAGEQMTLSQTDVAVHGHAIEARVYAEDPRRGFLPGSGEVLAVQDPRDIRVDGGLATGTIVTTDYDPMLAKVIAHGATRAEAIARLEHGLRETVVLGLPTNIEYLLLLLADSRVRSGDLDTGLIERTLPALAFADPDPSAIAAAARLLAGPAGKGSRGDGSPWTQASGWRVGAHRARRIVIDVPEQSGYRRVVASVAADGAVSVDGVDVHDGVLRTVHSAREPGGALWLARDGVTWRFGVPSRAELIGEARAALIRAPGEASPEIASPMPGTIVALHAATGDRGEAGDPVLSVEAMKMEHRVLAPLCGVLTLSARAGDVVRAGDVL